MGASRRRGTGAPLRHDTTPRRCCGKSRREHEPGPAGPRRGCAAGPGGGGYFFLVVFLAAAVFLARASLARSSLACTLNVLSSACFDLILVVSFCRRVLICLTVMN